MLLSEVDFNKESLSVEHLLTVVFGGVKADQCVSDVAIVLGSDPQESINRAKLACSLFQKVGEELTVVSGGVKHSYNGTVMSESEIMHRHMIRLGVKKENIVMENRSTCTIENMICSLSELCEVMDVSVLHRITIITAPWHLKRSLLIARAFFPRYIEVCGYTEGIDEMVNKARMRECFDPRIKSEAINLQQVIHKGIIDDIAF